MKNVYLFLTDEDKNTLFKKAQDNKLSVSTLVKIITDEYLFYTMYECECLKHYLNRGKNQVHLHIAKTVRNECYNYTDKNYNNAVFMYLHHKELTNYKIKNGNTLANLVKVGKHNTKIGRRIKETYDPLYLNNQIIRATYRIKAIQERN